MEEIKPMTLEELISELKEPYYDSNPFELAVTDAKNARIESTVRNVWNSAILYAAGKARPERANEQWLPWSDPKDPVNDPSGIENEMRSRRAASFNAAIEEYESNLRKLAGE